MKTAGERPFRGQRTAGTRGLEFACWLAALVLAFGLAPGALQAGGTASGPVLTVARLDVTIFPRRCVRRVIDTTQGRSERYIIDQLNRQCFNPIQRPPRAPACTRPIIWGPTVTNPRVFGCLRS